MTKNVAILLFNEVEVLDFAGPFEVFSITKSPGGDSLCNVYTVAETTQPILARNHLSINPDYTLENHPAPDIVIIPGGFGSRAALKQPNIIKWVQKSAQQAELVLSVCTGSLILAKAGLLNGLSATTHHHAFEELRQLAPQTTVITDQRFVDNDKILTSGGISAGIDLSFYVIAKLYGEAVAIQTAQYMEFDILLFVHEEDS
ncbi:MAG: DJ-1/PfpI family protein [Microcoleaceae cyanobacterium]